MSTMKVEWEQRRDGTWTARVGKFALLAWDRSGWSVFLGQNELHYALNGRSASDNKRAAERFLSRLVAAAKEALK